MGGGKAIFDGASLAPLLDRAQSRSVDGALVAAGVESLLLMENAGRGATAMIREVGCRRRARVAVLVGPGNNGGDGLVVARHLALAGCEVRVGLLVEPSKLGGDAAVMARAWRAVGGTLGTLEEVLDAGPSVVVDALFGTGLSRPLTGAAAAAVVRANGLGGVRLRVALDVPSGLDADSGSALGAAREVFRAGHTVTFGTGKPGLYTGFGRLVAGRVRVQDLGASLPSQVLESARCWRVRRAWLPRRDEFGHKGVHGRVVIVGGSEGMTGAALLAAAAAHRAGAGLVTVASSAPGLRDRVLETMSARLPLEHGDVLAALEALPRRATWVVGPGLGRDEWAAEVLRRSVALPERLVLDGDALTLLGRGALGEVVSSLPQDVVLTPHPLEAARLLGHEEVPRVEGDRVGAARAIAARYRATVVLKGPGTVVAQPDGRCFVNDRADARLGVAGSGDVLAGALGAALSEAGSEVLRSVLAVVFAHSRALGVGAPSRGALARELVDGLGRALARATDRWGQ